MPPMGHVAQVPSRDQHCRLTLAKSMACLVGWCRLLVLLVGQQCQPTLSFAKMMTDIVGLCDMVLIVVLCDVIVFISF